MARCTASCVDAGERAAALAERVTDDRRVICAFAALPTKQAEGVLGALTDKIAILAIDAATSRLLKNPP